MSKKIAEGIDALILESDGTAVHENGATRANGESLFPIERLGVKTER